MHRAPAPSRHNGGDHAADICASIGLGAGALLAASPKKKVVFLLSGRPAEDSFAESVNSITSRISPADLTLMCRRPPVG